MELSLDGKVALVTGSAVGIGRATAVAFGGAGAKVVVNYSKSEAEAHETARLVREAGGEAAVIRADVRRDSEARELIDGAVARFGRLDVLMNNAGITRPVPLKDLEGMTEEAWDAIFAVNVKGTWFCSRAAAPHMKRVGEGRIINVSSQAGINAQGSSVAYCVAKAAVIHLTKVLAVALAPEIRVNCIAPGFIDDTRWNVGRPGLEELRERNLRTTPLGRLGLAADVAQAALYLAAAGDYSTGVLLTVDGGRTL
jgi:3-oxoacyl-[acyl-carrier protein] reductase